MYGVVGFAVGEGVGFFVGCCHSNASKTKD
jgi:hypothetical protein